MLRHLQGIALVAGMALLAGIIAPRAEAQEQRKRFGMRGTVELGGSMTFIATQPVAQGMTSDWVYDFSMAPYAGYFILEGLELGVNPAGLALSGRGDTTDVQLRILFAPSYNFHTSTITTPFVEGLAGLTTQTLSRPGLNTTAYGFTAGGRVGIKAALMERGLLNIGVQFLRVTVNPKGAPGRTGSNEFSVSAGWTVWLL